MPVVLELISTDSFPYSGAFVVKGIFVVQFPCSRNPWISAHSPYLHGESVCVCVCVCVCKQGYSPLLNVTLPSDDMLTSVAKSMYKDHQDKEKCCSYAKCMAFRSLCSGKTAINTPLCMCGSECGSLEYGPKVVWELLRLLFVFNSLLGNQCRILAGCSTCCFDWQNEWRCACGYG